MQINNGFDQSGLNYLEYIWIGDNSASGASCETCIIRHMF